RVPRVQASAVSLPCYDIFELAVEQPDALYGNRFFDVSLDATFTSPEGVARPIHGFFFGGDTWKVRFRPDTPGAWRYRLVLTHAGAILHSVEGEFGCTPSTADAPVRRNPTNPLTWMLGNGELFFPIGL